MQAWWAEETSLKNIKNLTGKKKWYDDVHGSIIVIVTFNEKTKSLNVNFDLITYSWEFDMSYNVAWYVNLI